MIRAGYTIVAMLLLISLFIIMFGLTGCALKLYPMNVDERQRKAISDTARENFLEGMTFGMSLEKVLSGDGIPETMPNMGEDELHGWD